MAPPVLLQWSLQDQYQMWDTWNEADMVHIQTLDAILMHLEKQSIFFRFDSGEVIWQEAYMESGERDEENRIFLLPT